MKDQPKIIIYTGSVCSHCHNVKEFLIENNYEFEERNINKNSSYRKEVIAMGYFSVPVILIDGIEIQGDDLEKIKETIEERKDMLV